MYPLNPGEVSDRQLAPSKALCSQPQSCNTTSDLPPGSPLFSSEHVALYEKRYEEKYDLLDDPGYVAWLKIYHPDQKISPSPSSSILSGQKSSKDVLSKILVLPEPKPTTTRQSRRKTASCITDEDELDKRKKELDEKKQSMQAKELKRAERQQKQAERQKVQEERRQVQTERQQVREKRESRRKGNEDKGEKGQVQADRRQIREKGGSRMKGNSITRIQDKVSSIDLSSDESDESDATCPMCGLLYSADNGMWIACDGCQNWFNLSCTNISNSKKLPDVFYCENCVVNP